MLIFTSMQVGGNFKIYNIHFENVWTKCHILNQSIIAWLLFITGVRLKQDCSTSVFVTWSLCLGLVGHCQRPTPLSLVSLWTTVLSRVVSRNSTWNMEGSGECWGVGCYHPLSTGTRWMTHPPLPTVTISYQSTRWRKYVKVELGWIHYKVNSQFPLSTIDLHIARIWLKKL